MPRFKKTLRGIKELSQNNLCFCTALLNAIRVACSLHTCRYAPHKQPEYQIKIFGKNSIGYFIPLPKYSAWVCALFLTAGVCGVEKAESAAGESSKTAAAKKADDSTTVIEDKPTGKTVSENISGTGVYGKMETIIFPNIEFEDADIFSVIRYLNRGSKRYDPAKEGISIVAGFTKETASKLPKITMHFSKIPMSEVLRYVCQITELKFKIDEDVVIIGNDLDEMQTGNFKVRGDIISDIIGIKNEPGKEKKEVKSITAPGAKTDYSNPFKSNSTGK